MKRTKLTAFLLAGVLCLGLLPGTVFAVEPESAPPRIRSSAFSFLKGSDALASLQEDLPSSFDLRHVPTDGGGEVSYVTPVKVQNPFGTCWGFAAVAAAESSLLSSGLAAELGYNVNTLDLSEKHIAYFANTYIDDPNDPQYGEGAHFETIPKGDEINQAYKYDTGGLTCMVTGVFAAGIGPVLEKYLDPDTGDLVENPLLAYRGKRSEVAYWEAATEYDENNQPKPESYRSVPVWYSNQDDWSIPSDQRFAQDFRLKESIILPDPAGYPWNPETGNYDYTYQPEAVEAIKEQLVVHHRAVCVSFCAESYLPGQDTSGKKYMSENWAHFTNDPDEYSNHAVTVVGYDDNYPASNFSSTTEKDNPAQPEGDGAFLIKNSWGSELNDFPNNGYRHWGLLEGQDGVPYDENANAKTDRATGYFWISYYDRTLNDPETFVLEPVTPENTCYLEQMDYMDPMYVLYQETADSGRMANAFTAEATSRLSEIGFLTTSPGTTVSYAVYLLGEGYEDPEDGILIETGETGPFEYGGYHRIKLQSPTVLAKGQQYSVVIGESVVFGEASESFHYIPYTAAYNHEENLYHVGVINEGESFFFNGAQWADLSEPETQAEVTAYYYPDYILTLDNFPIKSYLEPITYPAGSGKVFPGYISVNNWQDGNPGTFTVTNGKTKTLTAEFRGMGKDIPAGWDPSFTWVPVDETMLSVTNSTPKKGNAVIKGLKPGITQLLVYAGDGTDAGAGCYGVRVLTIMIYPGPGDTYIFRPENVTVDDSPACTAWIICAEGASVTAYAARYDADGRFISMETMTLEPGKEIEFTVLYDGADSIRFFALDDSNSPVCEAVTSPAV